MNIAGRIITRSDATAAVIGSALGIVLAVAPGMVPGSAAVRTALAVVPGAPGPPRVLSFDPGDGHGGPSPLGRVVLCYDDDSGPEGGCLRRSPEPTCVVLNGTRQDGTRESGARMPLDGGRVGCGGTSSADHPAATPAAATCTDVAPVAVSSTDAAATAVSWVTLYLSGPAPACLDAWRHGLDAASGSLQVRVNRLATPDPAGRVTGPARISHCTTGILCDPAATRADVPTDANVYGNLRLTMSQSADGRWTVDSATDLPYVQPN